MKSNLFPCSAVYGERLIPSVWHSGACEALKAEKFRNFKKRSYYIRFSGNLQAKITAFETGFACVNKIAMFFVFFVV